MVMATHTHGGGPTLNWGEEVVTDPLYIDMLVNSVADAVTLAWQRAAESELSVGREQLYGISFVRIYRMKDGGLCTNPSRDKKFDIAEPYTDIDPELSVLAVKQGNRYVGAVVNFAMHPAIVATDQLTGDYISVLANELKRVYGNDFITVFINGACGNINHIDPFDDATRDKGHYRTVGGALAKAVESAVSHAKPMVSDTVMSLHGIIGIRYRKPTEESLLEAKRHFDSLGDGLCRSIPGTKGYKETFFALQAFLLMADKNTVREVELQLFRIGDCCIVGTPTQLFNEYGKAIKRGWDGVCMVSAFANDYCGYVPVPSCMVEGVYEARLCKTSCLESEAGDKITEQVFKMQNELKEL